MIGAEFTVKIHKRYSLACSVSSHPENLNRIKWQRCTPNLKKDGCDSYGQKVPIAEVVRMSTNVTNRQRFDVYINGTLVIKKVLPVDDGEMFICYAWILYVQIKNFTAILNIAKGYAYLSVI